MNTLNWIYRVYSWLTAIGFPLIVVPLVFYGREISKIDYRSGFEAGRASVYEDVETLFEKIKHGDDTHNEWLRQAIEDHFYGPSSEGRLSIEQQEEG